MQGIIIGTVFVYFVILVIRALNADSFWKAFQTFAKGILYPILFLVILLIVLQMI